MEQRTCNIIMCCKGHGKGKTYREAIANYMSNECGCPINTYNESLLTRIIKDAFLDYLDTCDEPSMVLRDYFNSHYQSDFDRIVSAFSVQQVMGTKNQGRICVNGFTQKMLLQSYKVLGDED